MPAVIVATGPSAKHAPLRDVQELARFIVIKESWRLAPWADVLYGLDQGWWLFNRGVPDFRGLKVSPSPSVCRVYRDVRLVKLKPRATIVRDQYDEHGRLTIGCGLKSGGGHSGFQAINLAVQFGATRIVLVGFDMTLAYGAHWHKEGNGVGRAEAGRVKSWCVEMDACAPQFAAMGVTVINVGETSALQAYPKMPLMQAVG